MDAKHHGCVCRKQVFRISVARRKRSNTTILQRLVYLFFSTWNWSEARKFSFAQSLNWNSKPSLKIKHDQRKYQYWEINMHFPLEQWLNCVSPSWMSTQRSLVVLQGLIITNTNLYQWQNFERNLHERHYRERRACWYDRICINGSSLKLWYHKYDPLQITTLRQRCVCEHMQQEIYTVYIYK